MRVYFVRPFLIQCIFCVFVYLASAESLPFAKPQEVGLDPKKLEAVNQKMEALIEENRLTGGTVVIARKGKVAHFETYGLRNREEELPVEKDTIFRIYSMTKAITSMAALMLSEEEKLNLDDPLSKFFPP